jgi:hypothetical protein
MGPRGHSHWTSRRDASLAGGIRPVGKGKRRGVDRDRAVGNGRPVTRGDMHGVPLPTANGHAQRGRRPAVILQDDHDAGGLPVVLVGAITPRRVGVFVG